MKIDMPVIPVDKDGASRAPTKGDKDFGRVSAAFDQAVREVGGQDAADTGRRTSATSPAKGRTDDEAAEPLDDAGNTISDPKAETAEGKSSTSELRSLQSLLGALGSPAIPAKAERQAGDERKAGEDALPAKPETATPAVDGEAIAETRNGRGMRLDVLEMETHFEPGQDGMVLVRPTEKGDKTDGTVKTEKTAAASGIAELLPKTTEAASAKPAGNDAAASVRVRFDEAVAQLGQGGREASGERGGRGGSSGGSSSTLSDLVSQRGTSRSLDAALSVSAPAPAVGNLGTASPFGLLDQVAGPILQALGDGGSSAAASSAPSTDAHLRMRAGGGALKTLTIQLHPEHLGTVDVSLRLNDGQLTIELAASQSDTAAMLLDDRASLRKLLEHAGFSLDDAAISVVTRDATTARAADSTDTGAQSRNSSNGSSSDNQRAPERDGSRSSGEEPERRRAPARPPADAPSASARSGSTYL
ncbi:flagellar hook-length control protein FliK [Aureimonas sp. ME7]|uniref:flagellar hook-length control protein FliK n=1 Tax=Aureimonas sp. ME7 TaxID=2744252 RepID=UPI0015F3B7A5|nr:flagellar hook-length control protein FliK [Aureimonas sp. ME7]